MTRLLDRLASDDQSLAARLDRRNPCVYAGLLDECADYSEGDLDPLLDLHDWTYHLYPYGFDYDGVREGLKKIVNAADAHCRARLGLDRPAWRARRLTHAAARMTRIESARLAEAARPAFWESMALTAEDRANFESFDRTLTIGDGGPPWPFGATPTPRFFLELVDAARVSRPFDAHFALAGRVCRAIEAYCARWGGDERCYRVVHARERLAHCAGAMALARLYADLDESEKRALALLEDVARDVPHGKDVGVRARRALAGALGADERRAASRAFAKIYGARVVDPVTGAPEYAVAWLADRAAGICQLAALLDGAIVADTLASLAIHALSSSRAGLVNRRLGTVCVKSLGALRDAGAVAALDEIRATIRLKSVCALIDGERAAAPETRRRGAAR